MFAHRPIDCSAPSAKTTREDDVASEAVSITGDGTIYLDTYPVTLDELRTQLTAAKAAVPDLPVVVKGDTVVQYGKVMEVLGGLILLGIGVRIVLTHLAV